MGARRTASIITLGCARNEVDSEELAGRLARAGWDLVGEGGDADAVLVNTCGFISAAKQESIETILAQDGSGTPGQAVIAVGCLAERYGARLSEALPEAQAVLGFDRYDEIAAVLEQVVAGGRVAGHEPSDRRKLLPIAPVERHRRRPASQDGSGPGRQRLESGPTSPLKIASGCDRRCAFCAIPSFRGAFRSRPIAEIVSESVWLAGQGVREILLVSENTTSFGKDIPGADLADLLRALDRAMAGESDDRVWIRLSYLQPAEFRPGLIDAIASLESVVPYFDMSFQHADRALLRRMRRYGSEDAFLKLIERIRSAIPRAGIRSNFIVGFPGETAEAFGALEQFVAAAELDAVGVFGYSDEDGTSARDLDGKVSASEIRARVDSLASVADLSSTERAAARVGERIEVLVEAVGADGAAVGRAAHQGPDDGETHVTVGAATGPGAFVSARVASTAGVDLIAIEET